MEFETMDANRKKIKVKTHDCKKCGKPIGFQSPDGIGFRFLPQEEPYCVCYKPKEPKITLFICGCKKIVNLDYQGLPTTIQEEYCEQHQKIAEQRIVGNDGFVAYGKINLDVSRMKVIVSTAKQQLSRHQSYPTWITSGSMLKK